MKTQTFKTTIKEYESKVELKKSLHNQKQNATFEKDWDTNHKCGESIKELEKNYFDLVNMVNVSYSIGGRNYYQGAHKIANAYFVHGRKATKGRGFYGLVEIETVTDEQQHEMLSDSYYY